MKDINLLTSQGQQTPQPVVQQYTPKNLPAGLVQPRNLKANYFMVKIGLASERPADSTEVRFYLSSDTFVFSYFDPSTKTWKSTTLV